MATKAKESTIVGKEKKAPSSNSHVTSTKRTTKPSTATTSSTTKANTSPSEKSIPNYLKPTISSSLDQPKSDATKKPPPIRRRSLDKPLSSPNSTKQNHPSLSRLHKALVSPIPLRSSNVALKSNNLSKPISDRTSKTPSDVKPRTLFAKSAKKSTPSLSTSTSTKKKVANNHASADSTNAAKSTTEASNIETEEVKEVTNQEVEVIKVENEEEHEIEHVSEVSLSPHVHTECELERGHVLEESDLHHNQADNEKIISTVSEEEAEKEPQGEKAEDEHKEEENTNQGESKSNESQVEEHSAAEDEHKEEENTNQGESKSNESQIEEHSAAEEEVAINEKEEQEGGVIIEDDKSENKNEDEAMEKKGAVEEGVSERVEEVKAEATSSKKQLTTGGKGKKESQVSNDVIEETASKLLEERKNKVRALAGAFQTVIDYQTPSKWEQE